MAKVTDALHLDYRNGVYHYRRRVPDELVPIIGKSGQTAPEGQQYQSGSQGSPFERVARMRCVLIKFRHKESAELWQFLHFDIGLVLLALKTKNTENPHSDRMPSAEIIFR